MAKSITKYTIFVSSPSDLKEERDVLEEVVRELNLTYGKSNNCVIELLKWETHSAPGISASHTQDLIKNDIGDEYDIFLGVIWKRFGTPTPYAESGTEEEFKDALARFEKGNLQPQILFYFKNSPPNSLNDIDPEQLLKVKQFKQSIPKDKMLYWEFDTIESFQNFTRMHIPKRIDSISNDENLKITLKVNKKEISDIEELGLLDYSEQFESLLADSLSSLEKISNSTVWIGEEIEKKTVELTTASKITNNDKSVLTSILKRIANIMNKYSSNLVIETPIFYSSFVKCIEVGINLINIVDDFVSDDTINELETYKESVITLRRSIPYAIESLSKFRESISSLPRIQKDINSAKRKIAIQLDELIEKLKNLNELAIEFSDRISSKIDKLKISNE